MSDRIQFSDLFDDDHLSSIEELDNADNLEVPKKHQMVVMDAITLLDNSELVVRGTLVIKGA